MPNDHPAPRVTTRAASVRRTRATSSGGPAVSRETGELVMSAHRANTNRRTRRKGLAVLSVSAAGLWLALVATPAAADDLPEPTTRPETTTTVPFPGPPSYPNYDPRYEVAPREWAVEQGSGLEATSVALGALGGIALAGAGLGITLGVQRRRDHAPQHST
jgi:hypothetical protein